MKLSLVSVFCVCTALSLGAGQPAGKPSAKQPAKPAGHPTAPAPAPAEQPEHPPAGHPEEPREDANWPVAKAEDVNSIDAIMASFYASTGGPRGQARDWDRFRSLFLSKARLIAARVSPDGRAGAFFLGPDDFVNANRKYYEKSGFTEKELGRRVEIVGSMAHVWSAFESRQGESPDPYTRGVYSLQLLKDGERWCIVSLYWDHERPNNPIPDFLKPAKQ